ncbi:MAG: [FeFe] hydrogenase H-cluster maturation GTPase HydF [Candidatus Marinimicrobia bacterium CG08_land_8_20_14_0_20_45_22]|nr:MAG: [FeFe] hydrogenase H-cluster maturation GTPase HydF [Candidatus Marinimicrobia bacterium CG08_land_8_20_14_0_20_45_22]
MITTPKGMRLHIGIFGRRNVGKSSLLNALTRQNVSIVSEIAGTTTDPVEKPMEMLPLGPVLFIDTAGIDDFGSLGEKRNKRTRKVFDRVDVAIIVSEPTGWNTFEEELLFEFSERRIPVIVVINKTDLVQPDASLLQRLKDKKITIVETVASDKIGILDLREALIRTAPDDFINAPSILGNIIKAGELIVLVIPIDKEAPKGRLILPEAQTIRDILDHDAFCIVVKEHQLKASLDSLKIKPALVVTDSQAFRQVADDTPNDVPLTSFSILFARYKGDFKELIEGTYAIGNLKSGDNVLIAESCSHHPITDDIGREKIPRWLNETVGGKLNFTIVQGHDYPENLKDYQLVIQCGSCMFNRREVLSRMMQCKRAGVPVTNYGLAIAYFIGILDRALAPFPEIQ